MDGMLMHKDFMQYVYARIEKALTENKEYMELESDKEADPEEVQCKAEELCYM